MQKEFYIEQFHKNKAHSLFWHSLGFNGRASIILKYLEQKMKFVDTQIKKLQSRERQEQETGLATERMYAKWIICKAGVKLNPLAFIDLLYYQNTYMLRYEFFQVAVDFLNVVSSKMLESCDKKPEFPILEQKDLEKINNLQKIECNLIYNKLFIEENSMNWTYKFNPPKDPETKKLKRKIKKLKRKERLAAMAFEKEDSGNVCSEHSEKSALSTQSLSDKNELEEDKFNSLIATIEEPEIKLSRPQLRKKNHRKFPQVKDIDFPTESQMSNTLPEMHFTIADAREEYAELQQKTKQVFAAALSKTAIKDNNKATATQNDYRENIKFENTSSPLLPSKAIPDLLTEDFINIDTSIPLIKFSPIDISKEFEKNRCERIKMLH